MFTKKGNESDTKANMDGLKRETGNEKERTLEGRYFTPAADIFETEKDLVVVVDMPGVHKDQVTVHLENNELQIEGRVSHQAYEKLDVVYSEYNVGNYHRRFTISNDVKQDTIEAALNDGVLTLRLPKVPKGAARKIEVS